jgi:hypothetical protein
MHHHQRGQLAQALAEGFETALSVRIRMGTRIQITYPGHLLRGLSPSRAERGGKE